MIRIIRALWLPSLLTVAFTSLAISLVEVSAVGALICAAFAFGFALDTWGRHFEYDMLLNRYNRDANGKRLWVLFQSTRCGREVMISVDSAAGEFYYDRGYRWYHFLPDNFTKTIRTFSFWKRAFGPRKLP